jgi:enoyl-CoA hydratase/carnithine racemase
MYENLVLDVRDRVAVLTVNRPETLNALDRRTIAELKQAFDSISCDDTVLAVVVTGAGDKAFVAGADIRELTQLSSAEGEAYSRAAHEVFDSIENLGKPVIAAVNGYALGGGCELAMACSIRVASRNAVFGQPEVQLGLIPGFGGSQRLPRIVGKGRALQLLLTGMSINADEAYRLGLVNVVVEGAELMSLAETMAKTISANGAHAVARVIDAVNRGLGASMDEGQSIEAELFGQCCGTDDMKARTQAFLNKTQE